MDPIQPLASVEQQQDATQVDGENYVERLPRAVDIFANETLGGQMDETISSRMARWDTEDTGIKHDVGHVVSEGLDLFQKDHGANAEAGDKERAEQLIKTEDATGDLPE